MKRKTNRRQLGTMAEQRAAAWLARRGFRIVGVNVRNSLGEIDIVAEEKGVVVFVEVKSKRGRRRGLPEEMLSRAKRRQLTRLAFAWLQRHRRLARPARFDVVAVEWHESGKPDIRHYRNAFPAEEV